MVTGGVNPMSRMETVKALRSAADLVRRNVLAIDLPLGSSLSCIEILTVLYFGGVMDHCWRVPPCAARDRFILSKGHAGPALYVALSGAGYLEGFGGEKILHTMGKGGSPLHKHTDTSAIPGVDFPTGALGLGLSVAAGMALGFKKQGLANRVFVLLGDGECDRGPIWEASDFIAVNGLANVITIVDANGYSYAGTVDTDRLLERWNALGFRVYDIDGHNVAELLDVLWKARAGTCSGKPAVIVARTEKGRGLKSLAGTLKSHQARGDSSQRADIDIGSLQRTVQQLPWVTHCCRSSTRHGRIVVPDLPPVPDGDAATRELGRDLHFWTELNGQILVLCPDVEPSTCLDHLEHSPQCIHVGLREQCTVGIAAGLAAAGMVPVISLFDAFLLGVLEEVKCLLAMPNMNAVILASHAGIGVGIDGPTHYSLVTPIAMRSMPNVVYFEPCDLAEARSLFQYALTHLGQIYYIRLYRQSVGKCSLMHEEQNEAWVSRGIYKVASGDRRPCRAIMVASGAMVDIALQAHRQLLDHGIVTRVLNMFSPTMFDKLVRGAQSEIFESGCPVVTLADAHPHLLSPYCGGIGKALGLTDYPAPGGSEYLYRCCGLSPAWVCLHVRNLLRGLDGYESLTIDEVICERIMDVKKRKGCTVVLIDCRVRDVTSTLVHDLGSSLRRHSDVHIFEYEYAASPDCWECKGPSTRDSPLTQDGHGSDLASPCEAATGSGDGKPLAASSSPPYSVRVLGTCTAPTRVPSGVLLLHGPSVAQPRLLDYADLVIHVDASNMHDAEYVVHFAELAETFDIIMKVDNRGRRTIVAI